MNPAIFDKPFFEVTLPLMVTVLIGVWAAISTNNRRLDDMKSDTNRRLDDLYRDMNRRFDETLKRLDKIDTRLERIEAGFREQGTRLTKLEERALR